MQSKSEIDKYLEEGLNFYGLGKFKKAIECWNKVLEIDPDNSLAKDYIESAGGEVSEEEERPPEKLAEPPPRTTAPPPPSPPLPEPDSEEEDGLPERKEKLPPITTTAIPPPEPDLEAKFNQAKISLQKASLNWRWKCLNPFSRGSRITLMSRATTRWPGVSSLSSISPK